MELMSSMICHYLARHWFCICHSFSGTNVFLFIPTWFNPDTVFCSNHARKGASVFFPFHHPVYILLQLPGNKPWPTYCCSPPFTTGNISQVYLPRNHDPILHSSDRYSLTQWCFCCKLFLNLELHNLNKIFRMKRRKGQFAGRSDFGDGASSSAACVSPANGEDDHFRETQWVSCHVPTFTLWLCACVTSVSYAEGCCLHVLTNVGLFC